MTIREQIELRTYMKAHWASLELALDWAPPGVRIESVPQEAKAATDDGFALRDAKEEQK